MMENADVVFVDCREEEAVRIEIPPRSDVNLTLSKLLGGVDATKIHFTVRERFAPTLHGLAVWVEDQMVGFLEC